ncbi:DNA cytosine methyltransferase, partial [Parasphingorhabdus sp.]|uniref:DNA cytosine methyltransferase n=1 Tax=Parasphingorhabdus sp. TaxID=2709688 RepID=UPI0032985F2C
MASKHKSNRFRTVDLFAGPGGLAEGFSTLRDESGEPVFEIALSVEKEASTFQTLRLRSFYRQFAGRAPDDYYAYIAGDISKDELTRRFPEQWEAAKQETMQLELGTDEAKKDIDQRLDAIRDSAETHGSETILIGGPPCQAYSLVGRARNRGIAGYEAAKDHRHFLYQEYIRIVEHLRAAAFVMENVKGILSSKVNGAPIFDRVLADMRAAGGAPDSYRLIPPVAGSKSRHGEFVIRAEQYGIPQKRHRVIVLGIRTDIANKLPAESLITPSLVPVERQTVVADVLTGLPPLRSGLSKSEDGGRQWQTAVTEAFRTAARACRSHDSLLEPVAIRLDAHAEERQAHGAITKRTSEEFVAA